MGTVVTVEACEVNREVSSMKFGIDMGHNAYPDLGAAGIRVEDELTQEVGTQIIAKLESLGYDAVDCTPSKASSVIDSLRKRVQTANSQGVDAYISIHFNSYNGKANGTEIFAASDAGRRIAQPVLENIVSMGFTNRKVKDGSHLYVLKNTIMPAILIEGCFVDSEHDMNLYNPETMANAIIKGLTGKDLTPPETTDPGNDDNPAEDPRILKLQQALNQLQIRDEQGREIIEDGIINTSTEAATKQFNQLMGISDSNRASALTWNAIEEIFARPTLRPNHAEGSAVRYVEFRVEATIDGIYDTQAVEAVKQYQSANSLIIDGIIGDQTWEQLLGKPIIPLALKTIRDTVLKQNKIPSDEITDSLHKYELEAGTQLILESWLEDGNHVKVTLANAINDLTTWYAFVEHIEIWQDGKPLQIEPESEKPKTANRTDAFNLPGFVSTFYLNDPIIPGGHFYWREALHGGQRIPKDKSHVDNIVALATRLEEVRQRLGGKQMTITSWYRPEPWNSRAGGASMSRHKFGQATDILVDGMTGRQIANILSDWSGGMGIYSHYPNLIHLDIRPYRARWGGA